MPLDEAGAAQLLDAADGDFAFKVGVPTQCVRADTFILMKFGSRYFRKMFEVQMKEASAMEVSLSPDWNADIFRIFLRFVYCHKLDFAQITVVVSRLDVTLGWVLSELLKMADYFQYGPDSDVKDLGTYLATASVRTVVIDALNAASNAKGSASEAADWLCNEFAQGPCGDSFAPFKAHVEKLMVDRMVSDNAFKLLCFATDHGLSKLSEECRKRIVQELLKGTSVEHPPVHVKIMDMLPCLSRLHFEVDLDETLATLEKLQREAQRRRRYSLDEPMHVNLLDVLPDLKRLNGVVGLDEAIKCLQRKKRGCSNEVLLLFKKVFAHDVGTQAKYCKRSTWVSCYVDCITDLLEECKPELRGVRKTVNEIMGKFMSELESEGKLAGTEERARDATRSGTFCNWVCCARRAGMVKLKSG